MARFRLIQISDLHFGEQAYVTNAVMKLREKKGSFLPDVEVARAWAGQPKRNRILELDSHDDSAAFAVAKFCYDNRDAADAILVTGDIACTGRDKDLSVAHRYITEKPKRYFYDSKGFGSLGRAELINLLMAGNHDRYSNFLAQPGSGNFEKYFGRFVPEHERVYLKKISKDGYRVGVVFADFTLRSSVDVENFFSPSGLVSGRYGQGRVYEDLLSRLEYKTSEARGLSWTPALTHSFDHVLGRHCAKA